MVRQLSMTLLLVGLSAQGQHICKGELESIADHEAANHVHRDLSAGPSYSYDITYHRLDLFVDPSIRAIQGSVTHHFLPLAELADLRLDLTDTLEVSNVFHQGAAVPFTHSGQQLTIHFEPPLTAMVLDSISIHYFGVPPSSGFGSFVQDEHEGTPVIWTLSQPYGAKDWWPCKEDLQDKADQLDLIVTTTAGNKVAGNGVLIAETTLPGGEVRYHWRHQFPIAHYLVAFAVTNYEVSHLEVEVQGEIIPLETWSYPEDAGFMVYNTWDAQEQLPLFAELFGAYPFMGEKYGHAQISWGGGMEHQTMSFMGYQSFGLSAHELAHQWFGDKVTCGSWEDIWLNEGFATYMTGLAFEFVAPEYWEGWKAMQIADIVSQPDGCVRVYGDDTLNIPRLFNPRLSYQKGAYVLHMLRGIMGDDQFFLACRNYLNDPQLAYAHARTSDLQAHLEAVSGLDLEGFFADWFHGEGHPVYTATWEQDDQGWISLALMQTPSHPSVDFFELPVPIGFSNGMQDTVVVLDHAFSGEVFEFQLAFQATDATIDPDLWLISGQNMITHVPKTIGEQGSLLIYPVPVLDVLRFRTAYGSREDGTITIRDIAGRAVRSIPAGFRETHEMDVQDLPPGQYMLELSHRGPLLRGWFIKL